MALGGLRRTDACGAAALRRGAADLAAGAARRALCAAGAVRRVAPDARFFGRRPAVDAFFEPGAFFCWVRRVFPATA